MEHPSPQAFALDWCRAWNQRDLRRLMEHYSDDIQFCSPRVAARHKQSGVGDASGRLVGKAALQAYFQEALQQVVNLRLDLQDVLVGIGGGVCIVYTRETGAKVAEVLQRNESGKVVRATVYYDMVC